MSLYKQTLEFQKHRLGDEHPDTLRSMSYLAYSYSKIGRDQEALQLMEQSLEIQKRVLGDEHCDTLWSMNILANSYLKLDRIQETLGLTQLVLGV